MFYRDKNVTAYNDMQVSSHVAYYNVLFMTLSKSLRVILQIIPRKCAVSRNGKVERVCTNSNLAKE